MTNQEISDRVKQHLLTQNEKSQIGADCRYRQDMTAHCKIRCAAGCLIEDSLYNTKMEGLGFGEEFSYKFHLGFSYEQCKLIRRLQLIHDQTQVEKWKENLEKLALRWNLKP